MDPMEREPWVKYLKLLAKKNDFFFNFISKNYSTNFI